MNKKIATLVSDFMKLDESKRTAFFSQEYGKIPTIEARARLFVHLPIEEAVRLTEKIKSIEMDFLLKDIIDSKNGRKFLIEFLPKLSTYRLVTLTFEQCAVFQFFDDLFDFLPLKTVVDSINYQSHWNVFQRVSFLEKTQEERRKEIFRNIYPNTFANLMKKTYAVPEEWTAVLRLSVANLANEKRIAKLCSVVPCRTAVSIIKLMKNPDAEAKVLKLLPQGYRDEYFKRRSKKSKDNLKSSQINVLNLDLGSKKAFFKKFPRSKQIDRLPLEERIEVLCA